MDELNEKEIQKLASELRSPSGDEICSLMEETNSNMISKTIEAMKLNGTESLLELGPGNGFHLESLLDGGHDITVVDISEFVLEQLKTKHSTITTVLTDGIEINFSGEVDKGFTVNTLYFWQEPLNYLNQISNCFKTGGEFFVTFAHIDSVKDLPFVKYGFELYDEQKLESLCEKSEFKLVGTQIESELVKTKLGENIERKFVIAKLIKECRPLA